MINDFLSKIKGQSVLLSNVMSLGIVQVANCLIPILIVPFVTNALNVEMYGKTVFAQNIISYLTILVNFGFALSIVNVKVAVLCAASTTLITYTPSLSNVSAKSIFSSFSLYV